VAAQGEARGVIQGGIRQGTRNGQRRSGAEAQTSDESGALRAASAFIAAKEFFFYYVRE